MYMLASHVYHRTLRLITNSKALTHCSLYASATWPARQFLSFKSVQMYPPETCWKLPCVTYSYDFLSLAVPNVYLELEKGLLGMLILWLGSCCRIIWF